MRRKPPEKGTYYLDCRYGSHGIGDICTEEMELYYDTIDIGPGSNARQKGATARGPIWCEHTEEDRKLERERIAAQAAQYAEQEKIASAQERIMLEAVWLAGEAAARPLGNGPVETGIDEIHRNVDAWVPENIFGAVRREVRRERPRPVQTWFQPAGAMRGEPLTPFQPEFAEPRTTFGTTELREDEVMFLPPAVTGGTGGTGTVTPWGDRMVGTFERFRGGEVTVHADFETDRLVVQTTPRPATPEVGVADEVTFRDPAELPAGAGGGTEAARPAGTFETVWHENMRHWDAIADRRGWEDRERQAREWRFEDLRERNRGLGRAPAHWELTQEERRQRFNTQFNAPVAADPRLGPVGEAAAAAAHDLRRGVEEELRARDGDPEEGGNF